MSTRLFAFLLISICTISCSDFSHMHYRHVKKVPASGYVAPRLTEEKLFIPIEENAVAEKKILFCVDSIQRIDSVKKTNCKSKRINPILVPEQKKSLSAKKKLTLHSVQRKEKRGGTILLVVLLLLFGLFLIVSGIIIFVAGFFGLIWWMIPLGFIVFLLGLLPFAGLFFGRKRTGNPYEGSGSKK